MIVTVKDIAARARVSPSTVSKVINRRADVGLVAVHAVNLAIRELGYVPARRGRPRTGAGKGAARRTNRIALLVPGLVRAALNSPVYLEVLHGVEAAVRESGKTFVLQHLPPGASIVDSLFTQKIDGVVLFPGTDDPRLLKRLRALPCVQMMGLIDPDGIWDHVSYDNGKVGRIAADYLLARGHRHTASISCPGRPFFLERSGIFTRVIRESGGSSMELTDDFLVDESGAIQQVMPERMRAVVEELLEAKPRASGVFLVADTLAQGFHAELHRCGVRPGVDLEIISCNNEALLLAHLQPRPATIDIHAERVGRRAVEQLLWRIAHPREPRVTIALEPNLVVSASG